jgi:hypothetical protein
MADRVRGSRRGLAPAVPIGAEAAVQDQQLGRLAGAGHRSDHLGSEVPP